MFNQTLVSSTVFQKINRSIVTVVATLHWLTKLSSSFDEETRKWTQRSGSKSEIVLHVLNSLARQFTDKGLESKVSVNNARLIMSIWSMMGFVMTTYYLSVQFAIFFEVRQNFIQYCTNESTYVQSTVQTYKLSRRNMPAKFCQFYEDVTYTNLLHKQYCLFCTSH